MTKEQKFLLLVVLIVAGASVTYYYTQSGVKATAPTPVTTATENPNTNTPAAPMAQSFSTDVTYTTPEEGSETIHVTMSLSGGVINDITFTYDTPKKRESTANLTNFDRAFKALSFKGKKIEEVSLSRTGGASLTTNAFMEAVGKIRTQATNG